MSVNSIHSNQNYKAKISAAALLVTIGIVFGDIGTSPLYVMKAIMHVNFEPDADYIIGAISCIIWTLTLQTTIKYVIIALRADNKGEGGILALYSLIKRTRHKGLAIVAAIGACMLIADGIITPAVTVTSALEGLGNIFPDIPVVPIVIAIITVIFLIQRFGTNIIGRFFGPFMLTWFLMLGILGLIQIGSFPAILKAFNPLEAIHLLVNYPGWFLVLGAVFLCTTGAEALYSDLGHCGRMNITVSWLFVKTMLILNYLGQGAWIVSAMPDSDGSTVNPFYAIMSKGFLPIGIAMATGAAIIASQALISGSFTIFSEAINLNFWPRLKIKYPTVIKGQLYIPSVNTALYLGCVATVMLFQSSSAMEAAYGLAITITMLMTTILLTIYMNIRHVPKAVITIFAIVFGTVELLFLTANMFKFMHGGWFTILIAGAVCAVMLIWWSSKHIRNRYITYDNINAFLPVIEEISKDETIPKYASNLVYLSRSDSPFKVENKLIYSIINKQPKRADHYWILRVEFTDEPETLEYTCTTLIERSVFSIGIKIGFRVKPQVSVYLRQIIEDMVSEDRVDLISTYQSLRHYNIPGDFRFIIIHRLFSQSSQCSAYNNALMSLYGIIRRIGLSDEKAIGLDTSNIYVENVPLIISSSSPRRIMKA